MLAETGELACSIAKICPRTLFDAAASVRKGSLAAAMAGKRTSVFCAFAQFAQLRVAKNASVAPKHFHLGLPAIKELNLPSLSRKRNLYHDGAFPC